MEQTGSPGPSPAELLATAQDEFLRQLLGGPLTLTADEVAARAGMDRAEADALWQALGFPNPGDEVAFTEGDVAALAAAGRLRDLGVVDDSGRLAAARVLGRTMSGLAESHVDLAADATMKGAIASPLALLDTMESLQSYVWRRHLLAATQRLAEAPEAHSASVAVGFTDLVSYTARTRELAPDRLDALLNDFERTVQTIVVEGGGRVIKTVGDEVMWVVSSAHDTPARAARTALALAGPDVRVGVAYGPTLARVGDHFGPTVNVAARLTALARPGAVLIDRGFADALERDPRFRLRHLRAVSVRGYDHLRATVLRSA